MERSDDKVSVADERAKELAERCSALLETYRRDGYFTRAALGVFDGDGWVVRCTCGGIAPEAVFDLASVTKLFTATLLLGQVAQGHIALDDPVLPLLEIPSGHPRLRERLTGATLEMLLTHTAGLPAWYPLYAATGSLWERLETALAFEDGRQGEMVYSDLGFILAGKLAEKLRGLSLPDAVEADIRRPLAIPVLTYLPPGACPEAVAGREVVASCQDNAIEEEMCRRRGIAFDAFRPHGVPVRGAVNDGNTWYALGGVSGHAGLFSDLAGLAALGRFYLNTQETVFIEAMRDRGMGRGLGFEVISERYPQGCGHTGFTGTSLYISRALGIGGALLTDRLMMPKLPNTNDCRTAFHREIATFRSAF